MCPLYTTCLAVKCYLECFLFIDTTAEEMQIQSAQSPTKNSGFMYSHTDSKGIISKLGSISLAKSFYGYYYSMSFQKLHPGTWKQRHWKFNWIVL